MPTSKPWKELGANSKRDSISNDVVDAGTRRKSVVAQLPSIGLPTIKVGKSSGAVTSQAGDTIFPDISEPGQTSRKSSISLVGRANDANLLKPNLMRRMSTKRPSLATYGRRVSTILGMRRLSTKPVPVEENPMQTIKELPKEARFSTTFSDEAQFAMLKGYEDVLHKELSFNYPEHRSMLLRNNTPGFQIKVKKSTTNEQTVESGTQEKEPEAVQPTVEPEEEDEDDIWEHEGTSRRKSSRRHSVMSSKAPSQSEGGMKRAKSLPFLSKSRSQLVLTHRFQSAIDILDHLRRTLGYSIISPRVNEAVITPVRDFNFWTSAWYSEFTKATV